MRPRILILSTAYLPLIGGSELAIRNLTERLTDFEFDMVTGRYAPEMPIFEQVGRVRVFRAGGRWSRWTILLPKLLMPLSIAITALRLMRERKYSLLHVYQASQAAGAAAIIKILHPRVPLLLTIQEGKELAGQPFLTRLGRRIIFFAVDRFTAISNYLAGYVRARSSAPIDIIPNGVDITSYAPAGPKAESKDKIIVSISRLVHKNGIAFLIRAMPHVLAKIPEARLVLVGGGNLMDELKTLAADLRVSGRVDFVGIVPPDGLPGYLHTADVFVRPSLSEGLGSAFLEAMAAKVPVVASRVGGIADFLDDEVTGLVCNPQDPSDIAEKIVRLLTDDALRETIIRNASDMVYNRYDWQVVAKQMQQVYREMI